MDLSVEPSLSFCGDVEVPGDKSISHRAIIFASLGEGQSEIVNFLPGLDCLATRELFQFFGIRITERSPTHLLVEGRGLHGLTLPINPILDCGNSGTTFRLLAGVLAAQTFSSTLIGDEALMVRPMRRIIEPLSKMGANLQGNVLNSDIYPPLKIQPTSHLRDLDYILPMASAQVKSCLLLAGLCGNVSVRLDQPVASRDHTERMMQLFGIPLKKMGTVLQLGPVDKMQAAQIQVPGDISSAAFLIVGAAMTPGSELVIRNVGINPTRTGIIELLQRMGANIEIFNRKALFEPIADLRIRGAKLHGIDVPAKYIVSALDEFPAFFIAAANAIGRTTLQGALELRVKESDRIHKMASGLKQLGIDVEELPDGMIIEGGSLQGGEIDSGGDHRIAMAFAVAALQAKAPILVKHCDNILTSFPNFIDIVKSIGLNISRV
jgi:3-phosphoshikimate 1-carboxyvinyltransferase